MIWAQNFNLLALPFLIRMEKTHSAFEMMKSIHGFSLCSAALPFYIIKLYWYNLEKKKKQFREFDY